VRKIPGIARRTEERRLTTAHRKFLRIGFADNHRACGAQTRDDDGVFDRHTILEKRTAARRSRSCGIDDVLDCQRHAMQRSAQLASLLLGIKLHCFRKGFVLHHRNECVELRIVGRDSVQARLCQLQPRSLHPSGLGRQLR